MEKILGTEPDIAQKDNILDNLEIFTTLTGTRSHQFIDPIALRCEQMDVVALQQITIERIIGYVINLVNSTSFNALVEIFSFLE